MSDMNEKSFLRNSFDFFIKNDILSLFCKLFAEGCNCVFLAVASPILVAGACCIDQGASVGDERHESKIISPKFIWFLNQKWHFVPFLQTFGRRVQLCVFGCCFTDFGCWRMLHRSGSICGRWASWIKNHFSTIHLTSSSKMTFCPFVANSLEEGAIVYFWLLLHRFWLVAHAA